MRRRRGLLKSAALRPVETVTRSTSVIWGGAGGVGLGIILCCLARERARLVGRAAAPAGWRTRASVAPRSRSHEPLRRRPRKRARIAVLPVPHDDWHQCRDP